MNPIFSRKLKTGDEVRVIAPSHSFAIDKPSQREIALQRMESIGLKVTFGQHIEERDAFDSSSVSSRLEDLHAAFADPNVAMVMCAEGGFNSNQLLKSIDWELIRQNPKVFCGYSDITALNHAIVTKTGLVTYSSPMYSTFGMKKGYEYMLEYFQKCVMTEGTYEILPSETWSDDDWEADQDNRHFLPNSGPLLINEGEAEGTVLGANLSTIALLQGTEYMPDLTGALLFIEEDYEVKLHHFDRMLQSILHLPQSQGIAGVAIGRFERDSEADAERIIQMIKTKPELDHMPVVANLDFGHANPKFTFPIGGKARVEARNGQVKVTILEH